MKKKLYSSCFAILFLVLFSIKAITQDAPVAGDLIITEFMANPDAVSDTKGEWIEIFNTTNKNILLSGLMIKDEGSNKFTIEKEEPVILPAGEYFLLARSANPDENGGMTVDYEYSNFTLGNTEDEIILCIDDNIILDQVKYGPEWQVEKGISLELNPEYFGSTSNLESFKWNLAKHPYGNGDLGSPGSANSISSGIQNSSIVELLKIYPNPCFDLMNIDLKINKKVPVDISLINIVGQETMIFENNYCDEVSLILEANCLQKGVWIVRITYGDQSVFRKVLLY